SGIPYTIINPVIFHGGEARKPIITNSNETSYAQSVSRKTIANVYYDVLVNNKFVNEQITVGDTL
ncbi:MAG: SDR family oxidoreductase, partial [Lactobacillaceae bacterium]|nr:SDR family oxidoreductase [Lactobacillaceae bacterium]